MVIRMIAFFLLLYSSLIFAYDECAQCCVGYGGISYADSSSGRYVCNNGYVSQCYSNRHAVMDLQKFKGCCIWEGGVLKITMKGEVICRDRHISELCTAANAQESVSIY